MVDPNRKINRLSEKDNNFLDECEQEFSSRYTTDDAEFTAHCSIPLPDPPLVDNWMSGGGTPGGGGGGNFGHSYNNNNRYNGGQRRGGGDYGWQRRGGYNHHHRNNNNNHHHDRGFRDNRRHRPEVYPRRDRGRGGGGGGRDRSADRPHPHRSRNESQRGGSPMQVRRDYGNFVPASKD